MNRQFGKYRLLDKIAVGGMAEIWLARQTGVKGFEKLVVLKKILPEFTKNKEFVEMFLNEARVAAMLTHSNIVQIYDLGSVYNVYYIAMEYIFGLSLDHLLIQSVKKGHPLPLNFSCHIISQSATGLHYAHNMKDIYGVSMNIVHRDISPQNILVSYEGIAKVVDFGIAKANTTSNEKTRAGKIKGKVSYMSPEQIKGEKLDGRSDVFALAIVLYEITTGKRLFPNITNPFEIMDLMINRDFIPPNALNPKYPPILSKIIMKALEKDKSKRYQSALAFSKDLERFLKMSNSSVFNNDISIWLKNIFKEDIAKTKERHENLLWEDDDNQEDEEETTNLLIGKKQQPPPRDLYIDEEETVIGKPSPSFLKYQEEENIKAANKKSLKKQIDDDFDFPDDDDFPDDKFQSPKAKPKKRGKKSKSKRVNTKQSRKNKKSEKNEKSKLKSFFSWIILKIILIITLYTLYFAGVFTYKYINTEQRFMDILENAIKQPEEELSIKKSVEFFCKNNEEVKCIKKTLKIKNDKNLGGLSFDISYQIEEKFLWEAIQYLPKRYRVKLPIKIMINSKNKYSLR